MAARTNLILSGLLVASLAACGGSDKKYLVPVDAPGLKPFQPPEADEFDDEDEWGEEEDEGDDSPTETETAEPPDGRPNETHASTGGAVKAKVEIGATTEAGDLSKDVIRQVIRRKLATFRHCYETELVRNPKLAGTVKVAFQITSSGTVANVASSGLAVVDSCVGKVIGTLQFPKPKGGGFVNVTYPFAFSSSN